MEISNKRHSKKGGRTVLFYTDSRLHYFSLPQTRNTEPEDDRHVEIAGLRVIPILGYK